jgi:hypothetical protein
MPENYPLTLPSVSGIARVRLIARDAIGVTESPFTFTQQVFRNQGQRWEADISLPPMTRANAEEWASFLLRLRGRFGTFLLGDPANETPRGSAGLTPGTPVVDGAGQSGDALDISGLPISINGYLLAGDYIQVGSGATARLHKVLQNVNSDGAGKATVNLWPAIQSNPLDGSAIGVTNARGNFRLASNETSWDISTARIYGITFGAIEAL